MKTPNVFPFNRVRLLAGPLYERQAVNGRHLQAIDPDRLLAVYRRDAGLPKKAESYGGWEARGIGGHIMGHYLSALAWHYAATGEDWVVGRVSFMVDELAACQKAHGDGGIMPVARLGLLALREGKIDVTHAKLNGYWVPFYSLHKVFAGLRDAYRLVGCKRALTVECELANWVDGLLRGLSAEQIQMMLVTEHGGMNEVFADLAADTGAGSYLRRAADYFHHNKVLDPILAGEDQLNGLHGNTQIPKVVGLAREYEIGGEPSYRSAAESFWKHVVEDRSYATGGHGENEHFFPPQDFSKHLTPYTCETCNSYNMLKLTTHLFEWSKEEKRAQQMDFVERTLINHLAANIGRAPGEYGYFLGLESVAVKAFSTPYDSWWCCVGTGLENPARYGEQIYFEDDAAVWVNLYAGSELKSAQGDFVCRQETRFPEEDRVRLAIECSSPVKKALKLRHPAWCEQLEVILNGDPVTAQSRPSSYLTIDRVWQDGDQLELRLTMRLQLEPLPHSNPQQLAVMFGPMLLAAVVPPDPGKIDPAKKRHEDHLLARGKTDEFPPLFVVASEEKLLAGLEPTDSFGQFQSKGVMAPADLLMVPLHTIYEEHYAAYLPRLTPQEWQARETEMRAAQARLSELEAGTQDRVQPGQQQPEIDHDCAGEKTEPCVTHHHHGRTIKEGGWCSYRFSCETDDHLAVVLTYWGGDWLSSTFDLLIDGERIATQSLSNKRFGANFHEVAYAVPIELTRGKSTVTLRIDSRKGNEPINFYGVKLMLAALVRDDPQFKLPPEKMGTPVA